MESFPSADLNTQPRGFTLIEMLVVLGIISILTSIMVLSQSTFNKSILLTDTAYNIAVSARQAQTFGLSSRNFDSTGNAGYGLHFERGTPTTYLIFADTGKVGGNVPTACPLGVPGRPDSKPGNCRFDTGVDGIQNTYTLSRNFTIQNICLVVSGVKHCSSSSPSGQTLLVLDMVFMRPNTTTVITGKLQGAGNITAEASCAEITLADPSGAKTKTVRVTNLGEISVGKTCS